MRIAIIADDLTSAADVGVQFARRGYATSVNRFHSFEGPPREGIVAVDTDSRAQTAAEAERRTRCVIRKVKNPGQVIYKAVDSTLRGHFAVELAALLQETGKKTAVIAPAFPLCDRITRDGLQLLRGRPIHETAFGSDPTHPVVSSDISSLLHSPELDPIITVRRDDLANVHSTRQRIAEARCVVVDSETQEDLTALVGAINDWTSVCWVGSPGLARALADVLPDVCPTTSLRVPPCHRILVVAGSLNPVTRLQMTNLLSQGGVIGVTATVSPDSKSARSGTLQVIREHIHTKRIVLLSSPDAPNLGALSDNPQPSQALRLLAEITSAAVDDGLLDGLILTGGATASAVLEATGIGRLHLQKEVMPGIALARGAGRRELTIVTKAGGFGSDDVLRDLCQVLLSGDWGASQ